MNAARRRTMVKLALLALAALPVLACSRTTKLDAGAKVAFSGGLLNGAPVEVERWEADGVAFVLERSVFGYALGPPAYQWQYVGSVSPLDQSWSPTSEEIEVFAAAFIARMFHDPVIEGLAALTVRCDPLVADASIERGLRTECRPSGGGSPYRAWLRFAPGPRGIVVQGASFASPGTEQLARGFWHSFELAPPSELDARGPARRLPVAFMGTRAASVFDKR
jgi:hypothetical protein